MSTWHLLTICAGKILGKTLSLLSQCLQHWMDRHKHVCASKDNTYSLTEHNKSLLGIHLYLEMQAVQKECELSLLLSNHLEMRKTAWKRLSPFSVTSIMLEVHHVKNRTQGTVPRSRDSHYYSYHKTMTRMFVDLSAQTQNTAEILIKWPWYEGAQALCQSANLIQRCQTFSLTNNPVYLPNYTMKPIRRKGEQPLTRYLLDTSHRLMVLTCFISWEVLAPLYTKRLSLVGI